MITSKKDSFPNFQPLLFVLQIDFIVFYQVFKFRFNFLVLYFLDIPPENADWIRAGNGCEGYLRWPEIISASLLSRGKSVVFGHIMTLGWSLFMQIS